MNDKLQDDLNELYRQLGKIEARIDFVRQEIQKRGDNGLPPRCPSHPLPKVNTPEATLGDRILAFLREQSDHSASISDIIKEFEPLTKDKVIRNTVSQLVAYKRLERKLDTDGSDIRGLYKLPTQGG